MKVKLALGVKNQFDIVKGMVEDMTPCNMVTNIELMYNTHNLLGSLTHAQLATRTHGEIRAEIL